MMYEFRDTTVLTDSGTMPLPAEAICFNGKWLDQEIPEFRTLSVSGRELMASDLDTKTIRGRDGELYLSGRLPSRTITVYYVISAATDFAYRQAYNKLNSLLSANQAKVIFKDEPDKYFIGTVTDKTDPASGRNTASGEFQIYCADPLKYSTVLKEFTASKDDDVLTCTINNTGTQPAVIDYEITNSAENGYIGIASDQGAMEYGSKEEADKEKNVSNQQLLTLQNFISASDDKTGTDYLHPSYGVSGTLQTHQYDFGFAGSSYSGTYLGFSTPGTLKGKCSGGLRTVTLPADSGGAVGAKNFYCYMHLAQWASRMGQTGELSIAFLTSTNRVIAGLVWYKTDCSGNTGHYELRGVDGKVLHTYDYQTSHLHTENPFTDDWGHCDIRKEGGKITYFYWGGYPSYYMPEAADLVCTKIQVTCKQYGDRSWAKGQFMNMLGFDKIRFEKLGVEKWVDVPNRYAAGTKLEIDGATSKVLVNGMPKPEDEVLGTTYFKAPPGETEVRFYASSWCTGTPTIKVRIREAWL